jgi:hypothetical protein
VVGIPVGNHHHVGVRRLVAERAHAKTPKKIAKYQDDPKGSQQCAERSFFVAPNSCKIVAGKISPKGWCQFFAKKA